MYSLVFFSRCELTHLYGELHKYLCSSFEIIHVAYSIKEESILRDKYKIEEIINFKNQTRKIYESEKRDDQLCTKIDQLIIAQTKNKFCLNSAIQSDRTFEYIPYSNSLLLSQVYYKFWENLIAKNKVKILIHEPIALFFSHIASIVCKENGAEYLSQIQVIGETPLNWLLVSGENGFPKELDVNLKKTKLTQNIEYRTKQFITQFRADTSTLFQELNHIEYDRNPFSNIYFIKDIVRIIARGLIDNLKFKEKNRIEIFDHVELFYSRFKPSMFDKLRERWDKHHLLEYDDYDYNLDYYYYPIHLEPEAVVLYWGYGIYKNQVKLIENIASQLPPRCYLYVKDHPHGGTYRKYIDYKRIKAIPNVKLIHSSVSGKRIINHSKGVLTISGTSGFEAILLNKQVYAFGESFYSNFSKIIKIENIRELRALIYNNHNNIIKDDYELFAFVQSYLHSTHEGFISFFSNRAELLKIDFQENAKTVAIGLKNAFENICQGINKS